MLRLDLDTKPGGLTARWRVGKGLSLHRRDGSLILTINAPYADERSLMTAAHALNFMFRGQNGSNATSPINSPQDARDHKGDGGEA